MSQSLPPELERFVENELASGRYRDADEVICEALRVLRERGRKTSQLRADIEAAFEQLTRDEGVVLDDEAARRQFFDDLKLRAKGRLDTGCDGP